MSVSPTVGVVFITHDSARHLPRSIPPVRDSALRPRILVVDSSSHDGTAQVARELGAETLVIPRHMFNHGATREMARRRLGGDVVVMMTPDAYADDPVFLERLVRPLLAREAATSYARQIPHRDAGWFESLLRDFNYPDQSELRGRDDAARYGSYTYFSSNACAAYRNDALDEIGGILPGLVSEDYITVVRLLRRGHKIAYVADAVVRHSHHYTLPQEFRRYFDTGYGRRMYQHLFPEITEAARGRAYARLLLGRVLHERPAQLPYAVMTLAAKSAGYTVGRIGHLLPVAVRAALSAQDFYWDSGFRDVTEPCSPRDD